MNIIFKEKKKKKRLSKFYKYCMLNNEQPSKCYQCFLIVIFFVFFPDVGCKRLDSDSLPFELFNELSYLLSSSRTKNYKHLADKLGYKYGQIKRFQESKDPVSALLDDYLTKPNPTKEELYNALLEINRYDVAARVEKEL